MAPEHALHVERRRAEALGDRGHFGRRNEEENGGRIDEAPDQPGTGDAVDLRTLARHPDGAASRVARRKLHRRQERQVGPCPGEEAAFEALRADASVSQPGRDAVAELQTLLADDDRRPVAEFRRPVRRLGRGPPDRGRDKTRVYGEIVSVTDVDDGRTVRRPNKAGKLFSRYGIDRRHGASSCGVGRDASACRLVGRSLSPLPASRLQPPRPVNRAGEIEPGFAFFPRLTYKPARRQTPLEAAPERGRG